MKIIQWLNDRPTIPIAIIAVVLVIIVLVFLSSAVNQPIPGADDGGTKIIVPQTAGLQSAALVCKNGNPQSQVFSVEPPPLEPVYEYVAELGADHLRWVDSGNNRVAIFNGETIVLDDQVISCFRDSR